MRSLSQRKVKRLKHKRERSEIGELLRNINSDGDVSIIPPQIHFSLEAIQDKLGLERQNNYQKNTIVLGEFYEEDPEVIEAAFTHKAGLLRRDLSNRGILTSLDSLSESEARDEYQDLFDGEVFEVGINNLKRIYS